MSLVMAKSSNSYDVYDALISGIGSRCIMAEMTAITGHEL